MKKVAILLLVFLTACKGEEGSSQKAVPGEGPGIAPIEEPEAVIDHSNRDPAYASEPTYEECVLLSQWQPGDPIILYWVEDNWNNEYIRIDEDGIILKYGDPHDPMGGLFQSDVTWQVGDCEFHIVTSLVGVDYVAWQGVEL